MSPAFTQCGFTTCDAEESFGKCASWKKREPCMIVGKCFLFRTIVLLSILAVHEVSGQRMADLKGIWTSECVIARPGLVLKGDGYNSRYIMTLWAWSSINVVSWFVVNGEFISPLHLIDYPPWHMTPAVELIVLVVGLGFIHQNSFKTNTHFQAHW